MNFSKGNKIIFIATDLLFNRGILCSSAQKIKETLDLCPFKVRYKNSLVHHLYQVKFGIIRQLVT